MDKKLFSWAVRGIAVLAVALPFSASAQGPRPEHFRGIINDYTAATGVSGPWEMHGTWTLKMLHGYGNGKADFSMVMTMEHPDSWIALNPGPASAPNIDNIAARNPHTHHITMPDATVSYDTSGCPVDSPATTVRFVVTGQPSITGNGSAAPFEKKGPSTLQVCVTGGTEVEYSNVTLQFTSTSPATAHFGTQAIHGVVRFPHQPEEQDHDRR
jgi:hypothetical protein